jgi:hypothetical protein
VTSTHATHLNGHGEPSQSWQAGPLTGEARAMHQALAFMQARGRGWTWDELERLFSFEVVRQLATSHMIHRPFMCLWHVTPF